MNEASKPTKKKVILIKLKNLQDKISPYLKETKESIFPNVEDIDIVDFLFYFNFLFPANTNHESILEQLIIQKDILNNIDDLPIVIDFTLPFITWLKKIA